MITIPLRLNQLSYILLVIIEDENLQRLKQYDPGEVVLSKLGTPWTHLALESVQLAYATPDI